MNSDEPEQAARRRNQRHKAQPSVGPSAPAQRGANVVPSPKAEEGWTFENGELHFQIGGVVIL